MVHKLLCIGDRRIEVSHFQHHGKEQQKDAIPVELSFQVIRRITLSENQHRTDKQKEHEGCTDRQARKTQIPGHKRKKQKRKGIRNRIRQIPKRLT